MNTQKLIAVSLLMLPGLSWAAETPTLPAPEPGVLALLGAGGIVVVAIKLFRGRK